MDVGWKNVACFLTKSETCVLCEALCLSIFEMIMFKISLAEGYVKIKDMEDLKTNYNVLYYRYVNKSCLYYQIRFNSLMELSDKVNVLLYLNGDNTYIENYQNYMNKYHNKTFEINVSDDFVNLISIYDKTTRNPKKVDTMTLESLNGVIRVSENGNIIAKVHIFKGSLYFLKSNAHLVDMLLSPCILHYI